MSHSSEKYPGNFPRVTIPMIPNNAWHPEERYVTARFPVSILNCRELPRPNGVPLVRFGHPAQRDQFPSLPQSREIYWGHQHVDGTAVAEPEPVIDQGEKHSIGPYSRISSEYIPPLVPTDETPSVSPQMPPQAYHEQMRLYTGIGCESYRSSFGIPEDKGLIWEMQCMRDRVLATTASSSSSRFHPQRLTPEIVQNKYHSLLPLDTKPVPAHSDVLGYRSCVYKALSVMDPFVYCLRRVEGFRLSNFDLVQETIEKWSDLRHPNIVSVRQAFATGEFQDLEGVGEGGSLVYVYDYIDLAQTVAHWQLTNEYRPVIEPLLWEILLQSCCALRLIHSRSLSAKCALHPSKLLISSRFRVHLNCVGLLDALQHRAILHGHYYGSSYSGFGANKQRQHSDMLKQDLVNLGKTVISLAIGLKFEALPIEQDIPDMIHRARSDGLVSPGLSTVLLNLLSARSTASTTAESVLSMSGSYLAYKVEQLESGHDILSHELRKTVDMVRLNKIMMKLSSIVDRPSLLNDTRWSNTGDRYILQLFRDYVFFQTEAAADGGRPFLDAGHITDCLSKVDVGSFEPVMLMSRDNQSIIVTNYNDIKRCLENAYRELTDARPHQPSFLR